ncbi:MAG: cobalamin biosynthesis protein [Chloroflexota bacterium]
MDNLLILLGALAIDLALGEPPNPIHPVVWIGKVAAFLEKHAIGHSPQAQFLYGTGLTLFIMGLFAVPAYFLLFYVKSLNFIVYLIVGAVLLKCTFSVKALRQAALKVKTLLSAGEVTKARFELRALVKRDTQDLPPPSLVSATVESVAENTCDSLVAPLFYFLIFGVPGAVGYRVVNTLDAMIGYHGKYEHLGKFTARLDDVLNFIPARLTALVLVLASFLTRKNARAAWQTALTEHDKTESPNAGWPMAAAAGALNVQLEKAGHYKLGKETVALEPGTIDAALKLMLAATFAWVFLCLIVGGIRLALTT